MKHLKALLAMYQNNSIKIQDDTIDYIKDRMEEWEKMIDERIRNAKNDGVKNIPYTSSGTNEK